MNRSSLCFTVVLSLILLAFGSNEFSFASNVESHDKETQGKKGQHHVPFNGICAPGFTSLENICVLNDHCGQGAYAGKVCIMDGQVQPYLRPLHQGYAGLAVDDIICVEGKQLVFKTHDATPACVNSDSVEKIKLRGWQTSKPSIACTLEYAPVCGMDGKTYGNTCVLHVEHMIKKHQGECSEKSLINSFEDCVNAGYVVMQSDPRKCGTEDGKAFVEIIDDVVFPKL